MPHLPRPLIVLAIAAPTLLGACASQVHRVQQHVKADTALQRACVSPLVIPSSYQILITRSSYGGSFTPIPESLKLTAFTRVGATVDVYKQHYEAEVIQELNRRNVEVVPCDGTGAKEPQARLGARVQLATVNHPAAGLYMTKLHIATTLNKLPDKALAWEASIEAGDRITLNNGVQVSHVTALANSISDELQRAGWVGPAIKPAVAPASELQK